MTIEEDYKKLLSLIKTHVLSQKLTMALKRVIDENKKVKSLKQRLSEDIKLYHSLALKKEANFENSKSYFDKIEELKRVINLL